jgi:membrane protein insertase Oxa1/YidC/SpoIIIJ
MRGAVIMLAVFAALYGLATATRRLFLSGVKPISDEQAPQSMWLFDAAFLLQTVEYVALLGIVAMLVIALAQWMRTAGSRGPGA